MAPVSTSRDESRPVSPSPLRVFGVILLLVFAAEGAIMLALPLLPPAWHGRAVDASLDATILTLTLAPAIWLLVVQPLRRLFEARGALLRRLFEAQEEERARVARDLHDGIGQHLTALLVGLRTIERSDDLLTARDRARELRRIGLRAHEEARGIARDLRPAALDELGLASALEQMCLDFERVHGVRASFRGNAAAVARLDAGAEKALYRIAQEALTNVARHAGASHVEVALERTDGSLELSVRDDGGGRAGTADTGHRRGAGSGLAIMRERAEALGAALHVERRRGEGTRVEVRLPLSERT